MFLLVSILDYTIYNISVLYKFIVFNLMKIVIFSVFHMIVIQRKDEKEAVCFSGKKGFKL